MFRTNVLLLALLSLNLFFHNFAQACIYLDPSKVRGNRKQQQYPLGSPPCGSLSKESESDFEAWLNKERTFAFEQILANIGPDGSNAVGVAPGAVLASPSKKDPNYHYQWIRDAAITIGTIVHEFEKSWNESLWKVLREYIDMQGKLQSTENPSGGFYTGGFGEPKFEADGSPFTGHWGRPQRDGPALRATTLISFLDVLNRTHPHLLQNSRGLMGRLYSAEFPAKSIIKSDLEYVSHSWPESGFDVWEEVNGLHFFTAMTHLKAMTDGREIAFKFNDPGAAQWYEQHREALSNFVWRFWDEEKGHLISTLGTKRSGLNCDLLLGSIHGGGEVFPPWSDELLVSMEKLIAQMKIVHPPKPGQKGANIGRYAEDIYDGVGFKGGNPWFICTASVADVLYTSVAHFMSEGALNITERNLPFFKLVNPSATVGLQSFPDSFLFNATMVWMFEYADQYLDVIRSHATNEGRLSEQFDSKTGQQRGARDLTWSYGSFVEAVGKRALAKQLIWEA